MSTTFLKVFEIIFWIVLTIRSFPTTFAILPLLSQFVNNFLKNIFKSYWTEMEGFEPSRRSPDLHP